MPFDKSPLGIQQFVIDADKLAETKTEPTGFSDEKSNNKILQPAPTPIPDHIQTAQKQAASLIAQGGLSQVLGKKR